MTKEFIQQHNDLFEEWHDSGHSPSHADEVFEHARNVIDHYLPPNNEYARKLHEVVDWHELHYNETSKFMNGHGDKSFGNIGGFNVVGNSLGKFEMDGSIGRTLSLSKHLMMYFNRSISPRHFHSTEDGVDYDDSVKDTLSDGMGPGYYNRTQQETYDFITDGQPAHKGLRHEVFGIGLTPSLKKSKLH